MAPAPACQARCVIIIFSVLVIFDISDEQSVFLGKCALALLVG